MKLTLDYSKIRDSKISEILDEESNWNLSNEVYDRLVEIEKAHIKRTAKIRRVRRALKRDGFELTVKNGSYGMKRNA